MIQPATLPLRGARTAPLDYVIEFRGVNLAGAAMVAAVRQKPDNPGAPDIALPGGAGAGATGLRLISTGVAGGVPWSRIGLFVTEAAMAAVPAAAELGQDLAWYWDMEITPSGGVKGRYLQGPFVIGGAAASSATPSTGSGAGGPDAIVTVTSTEVVVTVAGTDLLAPLLDQAALLVANAAAAAGAGYNGRRAIDEAPIGETQILVIDAATDHPNKVFYRDDANAGKNFTGTIAAFLALHGGTGLTVFNNGRTVTNQNGTTSLVPAGTVPFDWSSGTQRLVVKAADYFIIPNTHITYGDHLAIVADFQVPAGSYELLILDDGFGGSNSIEVKSDGSVLLLGFANSGWSEVVTLGAAPAAGSIVDVALRFENGIPSVSINGEPFRTFSNRSAFAAYAAPVDWTPTRLQIGAGANEVQLGRLRFINRTAAITDAEFQSWGRTYRPVVKASAKLGQYRDSFGTDGGVGYRAPNIALFDDGAASGRVTAVATSIHRYGGAGSVVGETPGKIVGCALSYTKGDDAISLGAPFNLYVPQYWSAGKGHAQSFLAVKCKVGTRKGTTVCFVHDYLGNIAGSAAGNTSTLNGSIRLAISAKNLSDIDPSATGASWSTIYQAGVGNYLIPQPCAPPIELPAGHPNAGRIGFLAYHDINGLSACAFDTNGTFTVTPATGVPGGYNPTEAAPVLLPNGDVLVFARLDGVADKIAVFRSVAATAFKSLAFQAFMDTATNGWTGAEVGFSAIQLDPDGACGPVGRIGLLRALTAGVPVRHGCRLSFLEDASLVVRDTQDVLRQLQTSGYCTAVPIFGGAQILLVNETSLDSALNARDCTHVSVLTPAPRANAL